MLNIFVCNSFDQ